LTAIELASIVVILAWNAFFVAAEYAFVAARRTRLRELADQGNRQARRVLGVIDDPTRFIAAIQVAITLSSIALGAVGQPALTRVIESAFGPVESTVGEGAVFAVAVVIAFCINIALHVVLGEIVPKTLTLARPEAVALKVAGPVRIFLVVFGPFIWALRALAHSTTKALGLPEPSEGRLAHSEEELKMLVSASHEEGVLEADEQEMLHKVFDFSETPVDDVMVPRPDVVALPVTLTPAEAVARVLEQPFTRYPVYDADLDDVCGVLHLRRLFDAMQNGASQAPDLRGLVRPAYFVPETKKLGNLLAEFRRSNTHLAVVVDEYGSTAGIVTLEDLLEQIVGEIEDEFDLPDVSILRLAKDRIRVEGSYPIEEFNERFGRHLPEEDYNSLGGFVFGELGRAAEPGDRVKYDGCVFRVHATDGPRILSIDVELKPRREPAEELEDDGREPVERRPPGASAG
jgi:CBS domain containing-hemolysin-like protein